MLACVIAVGLGYDRGRLIAYLCVVVPMFTVCFVRRIWGVVPKGTVLGFGAWYY